eukprot:GHVS01025992.1.p1 GENE.GHVS01025992.1~~GHVS01025992.1.p1  ORF type:complete len:1035 (+),score=81.19 GHVS01025992.1:151-3255(+)
MAPLTTVGRFFLAPLVVVLLMFDYATATTMEEAGKIADALAIEARLRGNFSRVITKDMTIAPSQKVKFFVSEGFAKAAVGTTVIAPMENAIRRCKLVQTFKKTYREASGENIIDLLLIHLNDAKEHHALFAFLNGEEGQVFKLRATSQESHEFTDALDLTGVGAKDIVKLVGEYKVFPGSTGGELNLKFYKHKVILYINSGTIGIVRECTFGWSENNFFFQLTVDLPRDDEMSVHITYKKDGGVLSEVKYSIVSQGAPEVQGHVGPAASPHTQREASPQPRGSLVRSPLGFTDSAPARGGVQCPASGGQPLRTPVPAPRPSRAQPVVQSATERGITGVSGTADFTAGGSVMRRPTKEVPAALLLQKPIERQSAELLQVAEDGKVVTKDMVDFIRNNPVDVAMAENIAVRLLGFAGLKEKFLLKPLSNYILRVGDDGFRFYFLGYSLMALKLLEGSPIVMLTDVVGSEARPGVFAIDMVMPDELDYRLLISQDKSAPDGWRVGDLEKRSKERIEPYKVAPNAEQRCALFETFSKVQRHSGTFCSSEKVSLIARVFTNDPHLQAIIERELKDNCTLDMGSGNTLSVMAYDDFILLSTSARRWSGAVKHVESAVPGRFGKDVLFNTKDTYFDMREVYSRTGKFQIIERESRVVDFMAAISDLSIHRPTVVDEFLSLIQVYGHEGKLDLFTFGDIASVLVSNDEPVLSALKEMMLKGGILGSMDEAIGFYMLEGTIVMYSPTRKNFIGRPTHSKVTRCRALKIALVEISAEQKQFSVLFRETEEDKYTYMSFYEWSDKKAEEGIANLIFATITNPSNNCNIEELKSVFVRALVENRGLLHSENGDDAVAFFRLDGETDAPPPPWSFKLRSEEILMLVDSYVRLFDDSIVVYTPALRNNLTVPFSPMAFNKDMTLLKVFSNDDQADAWAVASAFHLPRNLQRSFMAGHLMGGFIGIFGTRVQASVQQDNNIVLKIEGGRASGATYTVEKVASPPNDSEHIIVTVVDDQYKTPAEVVFRLGKNGGDNNNKTLIELRSLNI